MVKVYIIFFSYENINGYQYNCPSCPYKAIVFLIHLGLVPLQNLAKAMDSSTLYPGSLFSVLLTGSCKVKLVWLQHPSLFPPPFLSLSLCIIIALSIFLISCLITYLSDENLQFYFYTNTTSETDIHLSQILHVV